MRSIKKIVVHVSDSPDVLPFTAADIKKWHTDPPPLGNGWSDIGYHSVVCRDGTIDAGRPEERSGAHVRGQNSDSLGIVWVGKNDCTFAQKESLKRQCRYWMVKYGLSASDVYGHYEFDSNKTCPNLNMDEFRSSLQDEKDSKGDSVSPRKKGHLPDGPSEDGIDVTLEDIENQILDE